MYINIYIYIYTHIHVYPAIPTEFVAGLYRGGEKNISTPARLGAGALAGLIAQSATYPLDILRRRMQVSTRWSYRNQLDAVRIH